tara:strand:+ start:77 stop:373 length:297 start_codon:yes stop_codon:yes gene_type:complete
VDLNHIGGDEISDIPKRVKQNALSRELSPTVRIGKAGITDTLIAEIGDQLSNKELVKIKINRGLFDKNDLSNIWQIIAESTGSKLVSARGNVGVFWKS